ncbi:hypothetical protein ACJX0J_032696 [Zea mays]
MIDAADFDLTGQNYRTNNFFTTDRQGHVAICMAIVTAYLCSINDAIDFADYKEKYRVAVMLEKLKCCMYFLYLLSFSHLYLNRWCLSQLPNCNQLQKNWGEAFCRGQLENCDYNLQLIVWYDCITGQLGEELGYLYFLLCLSGYSCISFFHPLQHIDDRYAYRFH